MTVGLGATIASNGLLFVVGNGTSTATFNLLGINYHTFSKNLEVDTNAFLVGCGTINGNVVVDKGGTAVANSGCTLAFNGIVTNNGIMHAENGSVLKSYGGAVVNNGIVDIQDGTTNFAQFANNGTVVGATYFRVVNISRQANDINLTWTTVGGRSYVVQTNSPPPSSSYTNNFADLSPMIAVPGTTLGTTNYLDVGGATNFPSRYYRVRLVP
jgi:hypothetical protein